MHSVVLGQYTDAMHTKLEGDERFAAIKSRSDTINLLILIRKIAYDVESDRYPFMAQHTALKNYINYTQAYGTTNNAYLDSHSNLKEVLSTLWSQLRD